MATFAKPTYTYTAYAAFRPTYPPNLYTCLLSYHHPTPTTTHLDLGTGPGTVLPHLAPPFTTTHAVDPSPHMLTLAESLLPPPLLPQTTFHLSPAESLPFLPPSSIALTTAAQAAHWFNPSKLWPELSRITLRPGGTVAFWGYKDVILPSYPHATLVIQKYAYGDSHWGPYWSQPGRSIVQSRYRTIRPPNDGRWENVQRWEYEPRFTAQATARTGLVWKDTVAPEYDGQGRGEGGIFGKLIKQGECMLKKRLTVAELEQYLRTWSAVHEWFRAHPEKSLKEGGEGDTVDECVGEMARVEGWEGGREEWAEKEVDIEWGHGLMLCKRTEME